MKQRIKGMIGFARRAAKTIIGTDLICRALPKGAVKLVVISAYASANTKDKLTHKCEYYKIPSLLLDIEREELGAMLGKTGAVASVAICDEGFAREIIKADSSK